MPNIFKTTEHNSPRDFPWYLTAVLFASTSVIIGVIWDISWHRTIGRDSFWTPAHLAIYAGGLAAGLSCGWLALKTTFSGTGTEVGRSVRMWGFRAPLGAWVAIWGAIAMLTSAPLDDWWHNAYGLDVEILSPPHVVLALGICSIQLGALLMALSWQNRASERGQRRLGFAYAYSAGMLLLTLAVLLLLGGLLLAGAVTIVGAAVRESRLGPGEAVQTTQRRWGWFAMACAAALLLTGAYWGNAWWDAVDRDVRGGIFERLAVEGVVTGDGGGPVLQVRITDPSWLGRNWSPLVPDHGKLMHMFVVRAPDMDAFAHVHPVPMDSATFRVPWPDLPPGEYRIYGDIVHESGFAQTVVDTVMVEAGVLGSLEALVSPEAVAEEESTSRPGAIPESDSDDSSWRGTAAQVSGSGASAPLSDGSTLHWLGAQELRVDEEIVLSLAVRDPSGGPAVLEPYMGMISHAALTREDGSVFVHLHPAGTISMGSLSVLAPRMEPMTGAGERDPGAIDQGVDVGQMAFDDTGTVEFPYAFPQPGDYTIWVQVKRAGNVLTGAFQVQVTE